MTDRETTAADKLSTRAGLSPILPPIASGSTNAKR